MNNIFDSIPKKSRDEVFECLVDTTAVKIVRIISEGHTSPESGWYDQDKSEWVIVLRGAAVISFQDDTSASLATGDYINIPAHKKHRVQWTDPALETVWLAVHY